MFNNVGEKIKSLAMAVFGVNMLLTIIVDVRFWMMLNDIFDLSYTESTLIAVSIAILGIFVSWVFLLFVYGFGILVSDAESRTATISEEYEDNEDFGA